jgi:hypothetical protein
MVAIELVENKAAENTAENKAVLKLFDSVPSRTE